MSSEPLFIDFRIPGNLKELAHSIGISEESLKKGIQPDKISAGFTEHRIPKKGKKHLNEYRIVWEAPDALTDGYKSFARRFDIFARHIVPNFPHPCAYGYIRGRSTIDNAAGHCAAAQILHADIENFFPSITSKRIQSLLINMNIKKASADILTKFLTIEKVLPLGLHPSPLLANLVCLSLDDKFQKLASKYNCTYTRYADDITISGQSGVPQKEEVKAILKEDEFFLSEHKFRITKPGQAHYVTGLSVTDTKPRAPRSMKKRLRQELYYCKKYGIREHAYYINPVKKLIETLLDPKGSEHIKAFREKFPTQHDINRIDGMVRYVSHIEPHAFSNARKEWADLLKKEKLKISYEPMPGRESRHFSFYVDECEIKHDDKQFLALSFIRAEAEDIDKINATTKAVHGSHLKDPFAGGNKKKLSEKGLHYCDSNEDLRRAYINHLAIFPFKAYLVYGTLVSSADYSKLYFSLIEKILSHRLMACDNAVVNIIFEENSKISPVKLKKTIEDIYHSLKQSKNRCPVALRVAIGKKSEHPCFSIPDFLLGVFSKYAAQKKDDKSDRAKLFFEQLRDKYRVILDADRDIIFSRKRPFTSW